MKQLYFFLICLSLCSDLFGTDILGSDVTFKNSTIQYTYDQGNALFNTSWTVTGGTIISTSVQGTQYIANIRWDQAGLQTVVFGFLALGGTPTPQKSVRVLGKYNVGGGGSYCDGSGGRSVTLSDSDPGVTYYIGSTIYGSPKSGTGSALTWTNLSGTVTYNIRVQYNGGNYPMNGSATVTKNAVPTASISAGGSTTICPGEQVSFSAQTGSGYSYQWRKNGSNISGATASSYAASSSGSYTCVVTKSGCSSASNAIAISVLNGPNFVYNVSGGGSYCVGASGVAISLSDSEGGVQYGIREVGQTIYGNILNGTGSALQWNNFTNTGTYEVVASRNGCGRIMNGQFTVSVAPYPTATLSSDVPAIATGEQAQLTANTGVGYTYQWYKDGQLLLATGSSHSTNFTGDYSCTVTANGCSTPSNTVTVYERPSPPPATGNTQIGIRFSGLAVTTSYPAGYEIRWYDHPTTQTVLSTGQTFGEVITGTKIYYVSVVNDSGFESARTQVTATVIPKPEISFTSGSALAVGGQVTMQVINAAYDTYQWTKNGSDIDGATGTSLTVNRPAAYGIRVTKVPASNEGKTEVNVYTEFAQQSINFTRTLRVRNAGVLTLDDVYQLVPAEINQQVIYRDGLGRAIQSTAIAASPGGNDLVQPATYDAQGVASTAHLPYEAVSTDGLYRPAALNEFDYAPDYTTSEQYQFYQNTANDMVTDTAPYAVTLTYDNPLGEVKEQGAPGAVWQPGTGHTVGFKNRLNAPNEVRRWKADGTSNSYYSEGELVVAEVTDENGHVTITFTDKLGRTVLNKTQKDVAAYVSTYYVYDDFGRLIHTLPPKAVTTLGGGATLDVSAASIAELIFTYVYDKIGRLVEEKVPGQDAFYIIYDQLDRPVLTQDANQRQNNQWLFTKYDEYGRVAYSGVHTNATLTTRALMQQELDSKDYDNGDHYYEKTEVNAQYHGYSNRCFPTTNTEALSVAYYDSYDFDRNGTDDYSYDATHLGGQAASPYLRVKGLITGGKVRVLGTNNWHESVAFYDNEYRVIQTLADHHLGGTQKTTMIYNFIGEVLQTKTTQTVSGHNDVIALYRFVYDHAGRPTELYHTLNSESEVQLARYDYNALGQLKTKALHSTSASPDFLQTVDLGYNIRGWLTTINDPDNMTADKLFGLELIYNETLGALGQSAAYNGNITAQKWKTNLTAADEVHAYGFTYDPMDRLTQASYGEGAGFSANSGHYDLGQMSYDDNGNITALQRKMPVAGAASDMDDLIYSYSANQLTAVSDNGNAGEGFIDSSTGTAYAYDANGNMISDAEKDITAIQYNVLNKPETVTFGDGTVIAYTYDATGAKLSQAVTAGGATTTQDYVAGLLFEDGMLQSLDHPEGRIVHNAGSFEYQYAYTDHLGNVRLMYTAGAETINFKATMESEPGNQVDDALFQNVSNTVDVLATSYDEVQRLLPGTVGGAGISIPVYPGDNIEMKVQGFYRNGNGNSTASLSALIAAAAGAFGGVNGGTAGEQATYDAFAGAYDPTLGGVGVQQPPSGFIAAYLNYIIFDTNFNAVQQGFVPLDDDANGSAMEISIPGQEVQQEGFVYVYLTNESNAEVYFDDLEITVTESLVVQNTNYYPFGLHHSSSWTRVNDLKNNFLFNAGSELNEQTKNYETPFRQYDPALGRFTGIDALASSFSSWTPYQFAYNDPIAFNDPTGLQNQSGLMGDMYGNGREELGQSQYGVRQADYGSFGHGAYWNAAFMSFSRFNSTYGINQMSQQEKANFARSQGRYDGDFIADALGALGNNIGVDANGNLIHYQEHSTSLYSNAGTVWGAQYVVPQVLNVNSQ
ncbi:MAG: DUF6443 domain-containing protein, partial [Bacteroidota bacterium]